MKRHRIKDFIPKWVTMCGLSGVDYLTITEDNDCKRCYNDEYWCKLWKKNAKIDPPIIDIIKIMNKKGFKTYASCAGFLFKKHRADQAYVMFECGIKKAMDFIERIQQVDNQWTLTYHPAYSTRWSIIFASGNDKSRKKSWDSIRKVLGELK